MGTSRNLESEVAIPPLLAAPGAHMTSLPALPTDGLPAYPLICGNHSQEGTYDRPEAV
jgi:hypothetical protein